MDVEYLISEVKSRPLLWDPSHADYKDKHKKNYEWVTISSLINEDYYSLSETEKKFYVSQVLSKWRSVRDNYMRYIKKLQESKKSGGTEKVKKYIYHKQLSFLNKIKDHQLSSSSLEENGSFIEEQMEEFGEVVICEPTSNCFPCKRKSLEPSNLEKTLMSFISKHEENMRKQMEEDDDMSFFKSLIPMLKVLPTSDKLTFRISVMQLLQQMQCKVIGTSEAFVSS